VVAGALALLLCVVASWRVIASQWDFEVYYYAARPCARDWILQHAVTDQGCGQAYAVAICLPALFLTLFAPFAGLALTTAKAVYLAANWRRWRDSCDLGLLLSQLARDIDPAGRVLLGFSATIFSISTQAT